MSYGMRNNIRTDAAHARNFRLKIKDNKKPPRYNPEGFNQQTKITKPILLSF
jgi:hypothetical protein